MRHALWSGLCEKGCFGVLQDAVLDQAQALLLERVTRGPKEAQEAAPLLDAIARMGRAASGCLHRICALLAQRKALRCRQVAQALETIIDAGWWHRDDDRLQVRAWQLRTVSRSRLRACGLRAERSPRLHRLTVTHALAALVPGWRAGATSPTRSTVEGAWMLLCEVAAQDAAAPSWQFLERCWQQQQAQGLAGQGKQAALPA